MQKLQFLRIFIQHYFRLECQFLQIDHFNCFGVFDLHKQLLTMRCDYSFVYKKLPCVFFNCIKRLGDIFKLQFTNSFI